MEAAFRHVEEEDVIGNEEVEHRQEAEGEGLPEGGYLGGRGSVRRERVRRGEHTRRRAA